MKAIRQISMTECCVNCRESLNDNYCCLPTCQCHTPQSNTDWQEKIIKHLVDRFLGWRFPKDFNPDGGITFTTANNMSRQEAYNRNWWPVGTNLLDAEQAKEMFRFLIEDETGNHFISQLLEAEKKRWREEVDGLQRDDIGSDREAAAWNQALDAVLQKLS